MGERCLFNLISDRIQGGDIPTYVNWIDHMYNPAKCVQASICINRQL